MDTIVQQFFNLDIMARALPLVLAGLKQTLILCLVVIPLGLVGGLLVALLSLSRSRALRWAAVVGIDFFRAVPPLVLLIFIYSGLPFAGVRPSPLTAVAVAFFLNTASYYGEIYRAGIESVGKGQWDAARSTGLKGHQTLAHGYQILYKEFRFNFFVTHRDSCSTLLLPETLTCVIRRV